ncbi:MAG: DHH family phosphoesterase, partial [Verrucomicrobiae bacterium]|nr:DHH family phosphoesterase [Verrucomicrobiae bacterium]
MHVISSLWEYRSTEHWMIADSANALLNFLHQKRDSNSPMLIMMHDYPDPDALASACGLKFLAETAFNIPAKVVFQGVIGRRENRTMVEILKLPIVKFKPEDLENNKFIALVDTQPAFENNSFPKRRKATLVIDQHHSQKEPKAECAIVDTECGATSVILAEAINAQGLDLPTNLATALAYGIISDTMNLYRAHRPDIVEIYLQVIAHSDMKALAQIQNPVRTRRYFATLGKGINNAIARAGLIYAHLGEVENPDLVSQIADFLLTYKTMKRSFCTGRFNGRLHVSLRLEKPTVNAGRVLRDIFDNPADAGGHGVIAGGSLLIGEDAPPEKWTEAEDRLLNRLLKRFRIKSTGDPYYPFRQV